MKMAKSALPKPPRARQAFTSKSRAPGAASFPRSEATDATPAVSDTADAMLQSRKSAGRRFGIHAPHASSPRPKGV